MDTSLNEKLLDLLCYFCDRTFFQCEEYTIGKNGQDDEVVKDLIGCNKDSGSADRVPWRQQEEGLRCTESMDVLLLEAFCYH